MSRSIVERRVAIVMRAALGAAAITSLPMHVARPQADGQPPLVAAARTDSLLARLVGEWDMRGTVRGRPVVYRVSAQKALAGRYVEIHMRDTSSKAGYEARVFIGQDTVPGAVIVHWIDNTGAAFSVPAGVGNVIGDTLRFEFAYSNGPFRDRFVYRAATRDWDIRLESGDGKGGWRSFGDYVMAPRQKAGRRASR